jgi:nitrite reductase/ring-hydroxylating ferredoxin subunit
MTMRGITRFIEDLVRSRRPRRFAATDDDASLARTAITLRAARPGSGAPRDEFVLALHKKLARELDPPGRGPAASQTAPRAAFQAASQAASQVWGGRRSFLRVATVTGGVAAAGGAALAGAGFEHALTAGSPQPIPNGPGGSPELIPDQPIWQTVAKSAQLPEGKVLPFTTGVLIGFVHRAGGKVRAVDGICTHQGCPLILQAPPATAPPAEGSSTAPQPPVLTCPCHGATFAVDGAVLSHRLRFPLSNLPALRVREAAGNVQVYAPSLAQAPASTAGPAASGG